MIWIYLCFRAYVKKAKIDSTKDVNLENFLEELFIDHIQATLLTLICLRGDQIEPLPPCGLSKNVSSMEKVEPWFFCDF